jgi:hypothetical protein
MADERDRHFLALGEFRAAASGEIRRCVTRICAKDAVAGRQAHAEGGRLCILKST